MKLLLSLGFVAIASAYKPIFDGGDFINHVWSAFNSGLRDTWVAGENEFFNNMTFTDARALLGTQLETNFTNVEFLTDSYFATLSDDIPDSFDATKDFPAGSVAPIRDQQRCGSCWAFSAVETLTDRYRIATKNVNSPVLSPEDLVTCDSTDAGCGGGRLQTAWDFLTKTGVVPDDCIPYTSGDGTTGTCEKKCTGNGSYKKYRAKDAKAISGVANMQKEIMTNGPIQVAFMVYKSFMTYKSGVYKKKFWELLPEGGHAVKLVGWGTEKGTDYWLVANSWNTKWGIDGYFKIRRGHNECGIEKLGPPYAGLPAV